MLTCSFAPSMEITAEVGLPACGLAGGGGGGGGGGVAGAAGAGAVLGVFACWTNGSLVGKRSKERSCPLSGCAAGSESESVPLGVAGAETGVPGTAPGTGVTGAGVVATAETGGFLFSVFMSDGTSYASTARRITPPTAAMIFWRLAFALASNFLAITESPESRSRRLVASPALGSWSFRSSSSKSSTCPPAES